MANGSARIPPRGSKTLTGRRYLLGKAATHASLAGAERDDAQREADARQMR